VAGLAGFFALEFKQDLQGEIGRIQSQVERHGQFIDFVMRSSADEVETLRTAVVLHHTQEACRAGRRQVTQGPLRQVGPRFAWDTATARRVGARLEGEGAMEARNDAFYCDLGATLALAPQLQAMVAHLSPVARAYFLSAQGFRLEVPWRPDAARSLRRPEAPDGELWQYGQPEANPQRRKYWAPAYYGGSGLGLLLPVAAPVYRGERFLGVVAIEMRLDFLKQLHAAMDYALGSLAVVDAQGRVLVHPGQLADQVTERAGSIVIRRPLASAPWQLVYTAPRAALWRSLLSQRARATGTVLVTLGLLMALTYWVTWRGFIGPAARLVGHAMAESKLQSRSFTRVPRVWQPWFEAITRVFRESLALGSLRRELDIAARLQQSILPRQWPQDPRFDLWGTMRPAKDIGGDFYDHFVLPQGRCGLVVADVSGKGVSAGLFGMVSKTLLRAIATQPHQPPGEVTREVNEALCADNESSMFVTAFYGQYDPATGRLVYANAGHPPPVVLRQHGAPEWVATTDGTALGVVQGLTYQEWAIDLAPGDTLLVFTDGVTESINADGQEFGKARVWALLEGYRANGAREVIERLLERVERFTHGAEPFDDITCLALHCRQHGPNATNEPQRTAV
jgi:sigma-B regulation protein RsbU (phosphoserine phosphatase)